MKTAGKKWNREVGKKNVAQMGKTGRVVLPADWEQQRRQAKEGKHTFTLTSFDLRRQTPFTQKRTHKKRPRSYVLSLQWIEASAIGGSEIISL